MKPNYLLPHRWMRVGVWVLIATLAAAVGFFAACMYIAFTVDDPSAALEPDTPFIRTAHVLLGVLTGLGILLTAFSRERVEDEMIADLRNRSILTVACPAFLLYVVMQTIGSCFHGDGAAIVEELAGIVRNPVLVFIAYEILFRRRLSNLKKALPHEE